jgi:hypothetical protein
MHILRIHELPFLYGVRATDFAMGLSTGGASLRDDAGRKGFLGKMKLQE